MSQPSDKPAGPRGEIDSPKTLAETDFSGRQLGDFRLLRRLGRGAMAEVYLAEQCQLSRRVAVKVLKPELAEDRTYLKRFNREARAAAALIHANIVQVYEVGCSDNLHYIAQEYVEGPNLREWLARQGPPDLPRALSIMRQVAAALAKAAEQGVVHRDIKPENIMITRSGEVKVADFGLARLARESEATDLTQVGMTMGTPLYMSPEQVEGRPLDHRSDIYSFGVTCYHMLSGSPPFSGETALGVAVQHLKREPEPLELLRPELPAGLCRLVHRMLAKDPRQRCPSARDILRELRRLHAEYADSDWTEELAVWEASGVELGEDPRITATQQLGELMKTVATRRIGRRRRWAAAVAVLLAFAAGGLAAWSTVVPDPLLTPVAPQPAEIPRQDTALRQWYYASRIGTPEAWQSVGRYFPDKTYLVQKAEEQLAQIYLRDNQYEKAMEIFDKFAASSEEDARAFGLAGQCGVLTLQGKYKESAEVLGQLWPIQEKLRNWQMRRMLDYVVKKNRSELGPASAKQWEQALQEQFSDGP